MYTEGKSLIFSASKKDFRIDYFKASGKGGQKVNKTNSACRITHIDSKLVSECQESRIQQENKRMAFKKLCKKLIDHYCKEEQKQRFAAGTETIRTYHEPDDRVIDHASGKQFSYKHTVGKGDIKPLIEARRYGKAISERNGSTGFSGS